MDERSSSGGERGWLGDAIDVGETKRQRTRLERRNFGGAKGCWQRESHALKANAGSSGAEGSEQRVLLVGNG